FKKDFEKDGGHAHHGGAKGDSHEAKDCPYIKSQKVKNAAAAAAEEEVVDAKEEAVGHDEL
ncbi:hypothetical protein HDU98_006079, partial [Podochytrium sp. JEL0797]